MFMTKNLAVPTSTAFHTWIHL